MKLSVCALFYGDYPALASRLLDSLIVSGPQPDALMDIRFGLNAVGRATRDLIFDFCGRRMLSAPCYVYEPYVNVGKYPLMRRMFYDVKRPLGPQVMWFDDDSYLCDCRAAWWNGLAFSLQPARVAMVGAVHCISPRGRQFEGIRQQPWYTGSGLKTGFDNRERFQFATGAWWVGKTDFITCWNYPFPEVFHNGGDSILGELVRQQQRTIVHPGDALCCHCEACLKRPRPPDRGRVHINVGGRRGRRGLGVALKEEVYPWQNYEPGKPVDLSHHDFNCQVHVFAKDGS